VKCNKHPGSISCGLEKLILEALQEKLAQLPAVDMQGTWVFT
jgi:hypothetical protein